MWHDNAPSAYLVLALGNWLGGVTKGVTGFGSAILNLCCWIAFVVAGADSGSLQQAVVTEALSSTLIAPGLLYVTRAHATADFNMVAAISLFVGMSSPIGAAALAHWNAKLIELAMAAALLVIIVAEQLSQLAHWLRTKRLAASTSGRSTAEARGSILQGVYVEDQQQRQQKHRWGSSRKEVTAADVVNAEAADVNSSSSSCSSCHHSSCDSSAGSASGAASDCVVCVLDAERMSAAEAVDASLRAASSDGQVCGSQGRISTSCLTDTSPAGPTYEQQSASTLLQPLLASTADVGGAAGLAVSNRDDDVLQPTGSSSSSSSRGGGSVATWGAVLGIGAVAGTASGVMEGLTGMNGPPIIICYRLLNTPKATVRGNNAILNLLQMRLIPYYFMGLIVWKDFQLYLVACSAGMFGAVVGDRLSYQMQQETFQALQGVLMVLCCFLMFASGLGYV